MKLKHVDSQSLCITMLGIMAMSDEVEALQQRLTKLTTIRDAFLSFLQKVASDTDPQLGVDFGEIVEVYTQSNDQPSRKEEEVLALMRKVIERTEKRVMGCRCFF
jgi:UDP-2,3-diacylglucosamine pyrophosphatase LpxH